MTYRDARGGSRQRLAALTAAAVVAIVVPVALGFRLAAAGSITFRSGTQEPIVVVTTPGDSGTLPDPVAGGTGEEPVTIEDALTPRPSELTDSRITWLRADGRAVPITNGGEIDLGDGYAVGVTLTPYPPVDFDRATVDFVITHDGSPVPGATIAASYDMRFMRHGPFACDLTTGPEGAQSVSFSFFMFGPWQIDATVSMPGHEPIPFSISIYVWPTN